MFIITHRTFFYILSGLIIAASIAALALWGLKPSIDFKGGSIIEVAYGKEAPTAAQVQQNLRSLNLGESSVRQTSGLLTELGAGYILRTRELTDAEHLSILDVLSFDGTKQVDEKRFNSIGPLLGKEAIGKSFVAIILVILCIVIFITFAFRKVSLPVASWKYGIITIVALLHDVLVPTGAFAILGHYAGYEVDTLFVTALLVVLGFSVHDTIVVFDRVRENLRVSHEVRDRKDFATIVGESVAQTFVRSINTSLTTAIALVVLYFVGPEITKHFSLALLIGIVAGTYSSIFIGSPLLVTVERWQKKV